MTWLMLWLLMMVLILDVYLMCVDAMLPPAAPEQVKVQLY